MDEQSRYRVYLAIIAAAVERAELDAKRGDGEAQSFLLDFRGHTDATSIPYGRQQRSATQRWAFDDTEIAQRMRRARL